MSTPSDSRRAGFVRHGFPLLVYTAMALCLTWPLVAHFATHVTGDGIDDPALAWNLWWIKTRMVDQANPDIFHVGWMFHPIQINLAFYTLTPLNGLLSVPLQMSMGLVVANNLLLLSAFVLSGYGAYLLALEAMSALRLPTPQPSGEAVDLTAALVAGLVYAFASSKLFYASLGQFNIASSQWIPFAVLYMVRMVRESSRAAAVRAGVLAGVFLLFQAWTELTYASFLLIFAALILLWRLILGNHMVASTHAATRPVSRASVGLAFAVMGGVFLIGISPILAAMVPDLLQEGDFFGSGGGFADVFSADLMGFLVPTRLHPLFGAWTAGLPFPNDKGQHIFIGYSVFALAVMGLITLLRMPDRGVRRWGLFWGAALVIFWLLTLGPHVRWSGQELPIPGPFAIVSRLPFFGGNRYPSRYSVMLMLVVAVLTACGMHWLLLNRVRRRLTAPFGMAIVAFILFEHLSVPLPLNDMRVPRVYSLLASASQDAVLLELPTGWRNGARVLGRSDILIMMQEWYQTAHGLRRPGGNTSRNPDYKFQYFTDAPVLGNLIALMNADLPHVTPEIDRQLDAMIEHDRALAPAVMDFLGIEFLTVHVDKSSPALLRYVEEVLPVTLVEEWQGPNWVGAPSSIRLYRVEGVVEDGPSRSLALDDDLAPLYLGEGWSPLPNPGGSRYASRSDPILLLDLDEDGSEVTLDWSLPVDGLQARLNGHQLSPREGTADAKRTIIDVPPGIANEPVDRLELALASKPIALRNLEEPPTASGWPIGDTGALLPGDSALFVESAGEEVGNFARILLDGADVAVNLRGYNLAAMDRSGKLLDSVAFDTFSGTDASNAMVSWLQQWPAGTIIAGAVADEASLYLTEEAVQSLQAVGVGGTLRDRFRWSHAFVGAVGSPPGTAVEALNLLAPARVTVGPAAEGPFVYGELQKIRIDNKID